MGLTVNVNKESIKKKYFLFIFFIWIGGATIFTESDVLLAFTALLSFILFSLSGKKVKGSVIRLFLVFLFINVLSVLFNGNELSLSAYIGYNLRILIAYFTIAYLGWDFFDYYRKAIYIIALISIPFWIIQLIDTNFFVRYFSLINMSGELRASVDYWNFFVYTAHQGDFQGIIRNSGFGIEPGHFGFLLGFGMLLELIHNNFQFNKAIFRQMLIGVTTFSTTYFIFIILFLGVHLIQNKKRVKFKLIGIPFYIIIILAVVRIGIINDKIEKTSQSYEVQAQYGLEEYESGAILNRFGMFEVGLENFVRNPLGHGLNTANLKKTNTGEVLAGPNSLAWMVITWGVFFIFYFPWAMFKFLSNFRGLITSSKHVIFLIFSAWLFSTSIQGRDFLFFMIMLIPLIKLQNSSVSSIKRKGFLN